MFEAMYAQTAVPSAMPVPVPDGPVPDAADVPADVDRGALLLAATQHGRLLAALVGDPAVHDELIFRVRQPLGQVLLVVGELPAVNHLHAVISFRCFSTSSTVIASIDARQLLHGMRAPHVAPAWRMFRCVA